MPDLQILNSLTLVKELDDDKLPAMISALSYGAGTYSSRFARALRLFSTGKDVMELVDKQELLAKQDKGAPLYIAKLHKITWAD